MHPASPPPFSGEGGRTPYSHRALGAGGRGRGTRGAEPPVDVDGAPPPQPGGAAPVCALLCCPAWGAGQLGSRWPTPVPSRHGEDSAERAWLGTSWTHCLSAACTCHPHPIECECGGWAPVCVWDQLPPPKARPSLAWPLRPPTRQKQGLGPWLSPPGHMAGEGCWAECSPPPGSEMCPQHGGGGGATVPVQAPWGSSQGFPGLGSCAQA